MTVTHEMGIRELGKLFTPVIFNTMRILKKVNPGDTYLENYLAKYQADPEFFDQYHLAWIWAATRQPKRILEIGTRTGISTCQLLSGLISYEGVEVHCFDLFNDGFISPKLVELNLKTLNIPIKPTFHVGDSTVLVPEFVKTQPLFDWILVDGGHEKAVARIDLENCAPHVAPGGILVFDDISPAPGECALIDVWEAFKAEHAGEFDCHEDLSGKGTSWAIRPS